MKKTLKLYIDTSVWNFALETSRPDSIFVYELLSLVQRKMYQAIISKIVDLEISNSPEPRKSELEQLVSIYKPEVIVLNEEINSLANLYVKERLIPQKHLNDALHIASATTNRCEFIVSLNFKHIVRAKVIRGVHLINLREGYGLIEIVSPQQILGKRD